MLASMFVTAVTLDDRPPVKEYEGLEPCWRLELVACITLSTEFTWNLKVNLSVSPFRHRVRR